MTQSLSNGLEDGFSVFLISSANSLRTEDHGSPEMSVQLG